MSDSLQASKIDKSSNAHKIISSGSESKILMDSHKEYSVSG